MFLYLVIRLTKYLGDLPSKIETTFSTSHRPWSKEPNGNLLLCLDIVIFLLHLLFRDGLELFFKLDLVVEW